MAHRSKPILEMTSAEREKMFDAMAYAGNRAMLDEGRQGKSRMLVAAVFLICSGKPDALVSFAAEYGDNDGLDRERDWIEEVMRNDLLLDGETLEVRLINVSACELLPLPPRRWKGGAKV